MARGKYLTIEQVAQIKFMAQKGFKKSEIAKITGRSETSVSKIIGGDYDNLDLTIAERKRRNETAKRLVPDADLQELMKFRNDTEETLKAINELATRWLEKWSE